MFDLIKRGYERIKGLGKELLSAFSHSENKEALEQLLYEADLGQPLIDQLLSQIPKAIPPEESLSFLKTECLSLLKSTPLQPPLPQSSPEVIFFVGVNGSGKTTSVARLAYLYQKRGKKVLVLGADTFRAAAMDQLQLLTQRMNIPFIGNREKPPSALVYDAMQQARLLETEILLVDTAGRLDVRQELMRELEKMGKIAKKWDPTAPHQTLFVLDATTGQNGIAQIKEFNRYLPISGIILTKMDGTAKGGVALAIYQILKIPILWVGIGEGVQDLIPFDPESYVEALFK